MSESWWRAEMQPALACVLSGAAVGVAWSVSAPWVAARSTPDEVIISGDGAFALLGVLAGLGTYAWLHLRPGPRPPHRTATLILAALLASVLAWGLGRATGAPVLQAPGIVLVWPLVLALGALATAFPRALRRS